MTVMCDTYITMTVMCVYIRMYTSTTCYRVTDFSAMNFNVVPKYVSVLLFEYIGTACVRVYVYTSMITIITVFIQFFVDSQFCQIL